MRRQTILVVEDDAEVRNYLRMALGCQGFAVEAAEDGEEALARLSSRNGIDLVLLDIILPRKGGMEVLRGIRALYPDLPVIVLSGLTSPLNVVEAMKSGATDFLGKPVGHEELSAAIRKVLGPAAEPPTATVKREATLRIPRRVPGRKEKISERCWSAWATPTCPFCCRGKPEWARRYWPASYMHDPRALASRS